MTLTSVSNSASSTSPNVLLVIADDFGIDASPCYSTGKNKPNMPNLERCKVNLTELTRKVVSTFERRVQSVGKHLVFEAESA